MIHDPWRPCMYMCTYCTQYSTCTYVEGQGLFEVVYSTYRLVPVLDCTVRCTQYTKLSRILCPSMAMTVAAFRIK